MGDFRKFKPLSRSDDSCVASGFFPSDFSADWWRRRYGDKAIAAGALIKIRGRWMADPDALASLMVEIGQREAREAACDPL